MITVFKRTDIESWMNLKSRLRQEFNVWFQHPSLSGKNADNYLTDNPGSIFSKMDSEIEKMYVLHDDSFEKIYAVSGTYRRIYKQGVAVIGSVRMIKNPWDHVTNGFDHTMIMREQFMDAVREETGNACYVITFNQHNEKLLNFILNADPSRAKSEQAKKGLELYKLFKCDHKLYDFNFVPQKIAYIPLRPGVTIDGLAKEFK